MSTPPYYSLSDHNDARNTTTSTNYTNTNTNADTDPNTHPSETAQLTNVSISPTHPPSAAPTSTSTSSTSTSTSLNYPANTTSSSAPVFSSTSPSSSTSSSSAAIHVNFRTLSGQLLTITLPTLHDVTIANIKRQLEAQRGVPASHQRLIYCGPELADTALASECNIHDGVCLHVLLRPSHSTPDLQQPRPQAGVGPVASATGVAASNGGVSSIGAGGGGGDAVAASAYNYPSRYYGMPYQSAPSEFIAIDGVSIPVLGLAPLPPLTQQQFDRMAKLYQLGRAVKIFALIDCIFLFLWSFTFWPLTFGVLLALCGYMGAKYYRPVCVALVFRF